MSLNRAMLFLALMVSCYGLDSSGCNGDCNDDHDGTSQLQTQRSLHVKQIEKHNSNSLKKQEIKLETFEDTCPFLNQDTGEHGAVSGMFPEGDGPFPLAIYLQGTYMPYSHPMSVEMLEQMVQRGFVAVNIHYSNMRYPGGNCQVFETKASNVASCVDQMCEHAKVDCSLGLAVYGYSQGGQVAALLGNYTTHTVTAQLSISSSIISHGTTSAGVSFSDTQAECFQLKLPRNKRRILIGDKDDHFGGKGAYGSGQAEEVIAMCQLALGLRPSDCADQMRCLQEDGSGYYVATMNETGTFMSHMWFIDLDYTTYAIQGLSSYFKNPPNADDPWGAQASFDWLASTAKV
eukprot:TRINITY_DN10803_c0_g1_i2.p1 TRINITY_DN10803_c0_g1~~TRINITY_DN10803_c0_g1_i2.p1  ORF type:complete len:347 (+),score=50.60 TRINITY_DN10803_c0_g1_i2:91-1131(+)